MCPSYVAERCWTAKAKKCVCACVCACFSFFTRANTVLWSVCFQPFPQQVSSDTRRRCLIPPTQRARLKTASPPWETVWLESSTQTWQQPSAHSSQGQLAYFAHEKNAVLCGTHLLPAFAKICSHRSIFIKNVKRKRVHGVGATIWKSQCWYSAACFILFFVNS